MKTQGQIEAEIDYYLIDRMQNWNYTPDEAVEYTVAKGYFRVDVVDRMNELWKPIR